MSKENGKFAFHLLAPSPEAFAVATPDAETVVSIFECVVPTIERTLND